MLRLQGTAKCTKDAAIFRTKIKLPEHMLYGRFYNQIILDYCANARFEKFLLYTVIT
jgi:hypothetical protein